MTKYQVLELGLPIGPPPELWGKDRFGSRPLFDPVTAITGGISAGTSILGGLLGSSAAKKAAAIQQQNAQHVADMASQATAGAQKGEGEAVGIANQGIGDAVTGANSTLKNIFDLQSGNLNPYLQAGKQGITSLADMLGPNGELTKQFSFDGKDLASEPGYKFGLDQGLEASKRAAAAGGALLSGGNLKELTQYGTDYAGTKFNDAYSRALQTFQTNRSNTLNGLGMLIGAGQTGTAQYNQAAQNFGDTTSTNLMSGGLNQASNTLRAAEFGGDMGLKGAQIAGEALTGGANAQAAGTVGAANAWSGALGGIGNTANMVMLSNLFSPGASAGGGGGLKATRPFSLPFSPGAPPVNTGMPMTLNGIGLPGFITSAAQPSGPSM